jgi:hypothetical protein
MIEAQINPKINIKELFTNENENHGSAPFVAERDLTSADWKIISDFISNPDPEYFDSYREHIFNYWPNFKILSPNRFQKIYSSDDEFQEERDELIENTAGELLDSYFNRRTSGMKLFSYLKIFPMIPQWTPYKAKSYRSDENVLEGVKKVFHSVYANSPHSDLEKLDHNLLLKNLFLDDFSKLETEKYFDANLNDIMQYPAESLSLDSIPYIAKHKMVFPDRISDLNIPNDVWKKWKDHLFNIDKKNNPGLFLEYATSLAVLAADEIRATSDGIEISNKTRNDYLEINKIPLLRKF